MINIYLINAVLLFLTTLYGSRNRKLINFRLKNDSKVVNNDFFIIVIWAIIMWMEYGFRGDYTKDYRNYQTWFTIFNQYDIKGVLNYRGVEKGFALLNFLVGKLSDNYQVFLMISGAIAIILILLSSWRLTEVKWPPLLVLIGTGLFYGGFNLNAQFLAASLFAVAIVYIYKGDFVKYLTFVILAFFMQKSAIVMLPLYFLLRHKGSKRYRNIMVLLFVIVSGALMFGMGPIAKQLSSFLYQDIYVSSTRGGSSISYIVKCLSLVAIIIAFTKLFDLDEIRDRMAYYGSLLYGAVILWSISFSMIQRFAYFLILFPMMAISIIFERFSNKTALAIILGVYFFAMQFGWFSQPYVFYQP